MLLTRALLPHLRACRGAQVICVGSALGRIGLPGYSVYSASKFGLRGFAEALRRELGERGGRVQYLGPRSTRTPFNTRRRAGLQPATGTAMDSPEARRARSLLQLMEGEAAERFSASPKSWPCASTAWCPACWTVLRQAPAQPAWSRRRQSESPVAAL